MSKLLGQIYKKQSPLHGGATGPSPTLEVETDEDEDTSTDSNSDNTSSSDSETTDYGSGTGSGATNTDPDNDDTDDDSTSWDYVMPSECPGGCAIGLECIDGQCVDPSTGEEQEPELVLDNNNAGGGVPTHEAEGQNVIKNLKNMLKNVDPKVWYAVGGGTALLLILNSN